MKYAVRRHFYQVARMVLPVHGATWQRPPEPQGSVSGGRVAKLFVGQGYGFIRTVNGREVYFHRKDLAKGTSINDLRVRDAVIFELLEDRVSGARAVRVTQQRRR